eukprot:m51a1_g4148 hypothetical protein (240) ;mRNA; f:243865-244655
MEAELAGVMWAPIKGTRYLLKAVFRIEDEVPMYCLAVTDLCDVWCSRASGDALLAELRRNNPHLETKLSQVFAILEEELRSPDITQRESRLLVRVERKIGFYKFGWAFDCSPLPDRDRGSLLRTQLIEPLIAVCCSLDTGAAQGTAKPQVPVLALGTASADAFTRYVRWRVLGETEAPSESAAAAAAAEQMSRAASFGVRDDDGAGDDSDLERKRRREIEAKLAGAYERKPKKPRMKFV